MTAQARAQARAELAAARARADHKPDLSDQPEIDTEPEEQQ